MTPTNIVGVHRAESFGMVRLRPNRSFKRAAKRTSGYRLPLGSKGIMWTTALARLGPSIPKPPVNEGRMVASRASFAGGYLGAYIRTPSDLLYVK